jgi:hypothetical protein
MLPPYKFSREFVRSSDGLWGREVSLIPSHELVGNGLSQLLLRLAGRPLLVITQNRIDDRPDHCGPADGTARSSADVDGYVVEMSNLVKSKKYAYLGRRRRGRGVWFIHIGESARGIRTRHNPEYRIA